MRQWTFVFLGLVLAYGSWAGAQNIEDIVFYDSFESGALDGWSDVAGRG